MKSKTFFHVSAGFLMLTVAYHFGARNAVADFAPERGSHVIGASTGADSYALRSDGTIWHHVAPDGWQQESWYPPIPPELLAETIFYGQQRVITRDGSLWAPTSSGWIRMGSPIPPPAVSTMNGTWSKLKTQYRN